MYEHFYGLSERPFDLTPNPRYLLMTTKHREALSHLEYGITGRKGITVLIGEAGTGKTTLVHRVLDQQRQNNVLTVCVSNPLLSRDEFFEYVAWGFGLDAAITASKTRFLMALTEALVQRRAGGGGSALLVDEAQCLSHELLEEIRLLANIETETDKLLPVLLIGQPELADRINEPSLRQLKQRIALRCTLSPLDANETGAYIANRIAIAGGEAQRIFTAGAVAAVFEHSRGIPRTVSVICDNALVNGFANDERPISRATVLDVCRDFDLYTGDGAAAVAATSAAPAPAPRKPSSFF
jgi:general secretion pathway protein A